ncbi:MAG: lysine--tRNA ligase [Polyangiaceae bacterium]|nr:lysine--tRNA ligase [Polyangiaceae bacterium]
MSELEGSSEESLIQIRREKAERLRGLGQNPFANDVDVADRAEVRSLRNQFASALLEPHADLRYDAEKVAALAGDASFHVVGRLMSRRGFGKAVFMEFRDGTGALQLFAKKDVMGEGFASLDTLDVADHIEARGSAMVTKTGELTIMVVSLRVLTKALRPLPDKWHGLTAVDIRYRRRYVDLVANPSVAAVFQARSLIVQGVRDYLDRRQFLEVETPTLHQLVGGAAAKPFHTHHNALDLELFLRIAPELYLKRLLVGGFERVYEIGRAYRNEGISTRHNPEFTMLEFYQAYATHETLMTMAEELFRHVDRFVEVGMAERGLESIYREFKAARAFTLDEPFARVALSVAVKRGLERAGVADSLVAELASVAPHRHEKGADQSALKALAEQLKAKSERARAIDWRNLGLALKGCGSDGERAFVMYEYIAEPFLPADFRSQNGEKSLPVFIVDYPREVSPLARRKDADGSLVDRFELFIEGREICNAFSELNDPIDQAERFADQVAKKSEGAEETMDYDEDYIMALEHGMPPAAGFGMGIDRLVMALTSQASIRDVIAFPLLRPES